MPIQRRSSMFAPAKKAPDYLAEEEPRDPREELAARLLAAKENTKRVERKVRGQRGMYPEPEASAYPETWGEIGMDVAKGAGQGIRNAGEGTLGMLGDAQKFMLGLGGLEDYAYMPTTEDIFEYTGRGLKAYQPTTPFGQAAQFAGENLDPTELGLAGGAKKGAGLLARLMRKR